MNLRHRFWLVVVQAAILTVAVLPCMADEDPIFGTVKLERTLSARYRLTRTEMKVLRPLIRRDNRSVAVMYLAASDDQRSDYMYLWEEARQSRERFESSVNASLNKREWAALKMARAEFETRILDYWVEDYLDFLAQTLQLSNIQLVLVRVTFENDRERRKRSLVQFSRSPGLRAEWSELDTDREASLSRVLRSEQLQTYQSLTRPEPQLIASTRRPFYRAY